MSKLISYAQNFEDVMLWRALSHVVNGCYVDVGAQSPDTDSVSRMFYEHGWRGVHVEPTPQYANLLRDRRPDEVVLQVAVSDQPGILQFFNIADTGLSTTDPAIAAEHREAGFNVSDVRVPALTLDTVLEQVPATDIHWLKVDVEGAEELVLRGWQRDTRLPWLVVVESTRPLSSEQSHQNWEPILLDKGYRFVYFDGLNRFYASAQHPELDAAFESGPNVFDDFSLSSGSQFCSQINLAYHELQTLADRREVELNERIQDLDAALQRAQEASAEATEHNARAMERLRSEHEGAVRAMAVAQRELVSKHERERTLLDRKALTELHELAEQVTKGKHEAHRWWLAHEQLRAQLDAIERSRSWQLTRPFRAVRRRLSSSVLGRMKRALRPAVVRALKVAMAAPWLRRLTRPLVTRIPFLHQRLQKIAISEQLFEIERVRLAAMEGNEHEVTVVHLDRRARRVLEDLKRSRNERAAR
jgi:FkbM family methyltransferase